MPKRKRGDVADSEEAPGTAKSRNAELLERRLQGVIENGKTQLFRALKLARGLERQKLGKRQKNARQKKASSEEVNRLAEEARVLKVFKAVRFTFRHIMAH